MSEIEFAERLVSDYDADSDVAEDAAARATELGEEFELEAVTEDILNRLADAPYDAFERKWNWAVGDLCADLDDCTNSRDYRFEGFDTVAAVQ